MATTKKKKIEPQYTITLLFGGKEYKGDGATPFQAVMSLQKPGKLMGRGIVTISNGKTTKKVSMTPVQLKRLFYLSPSLVEVKAKQLFAIT